MQQLEITPAEDIVADEAALVAGARTRNETALRTIMQANNRRLFRIARGILRNDSDAEDAVQDAYIRAFTHLDQFRAESRLSTWLARIAMNEALGRLRRRRTAPLPISLDSDHQAEIVRFPLSNPLDDPEKTMAQREIQHLVERAIDQLPEPFRMVFITRVIEGMTIEETAEILGVKPETIKTRLHRARTMIRDIVERQIGPVVMEAFPFAGKRCDRVCDRVLQQLSLLP